jgi:hypothetical protein
MCVTVIRRVHIYVYVNVYVHELFELYILRMDANIVHLPTPDG